MVSRAAYLGVKHPSEAQDRFLLLSDSCGFVDVERPLWRKDGTGLSFTIAAGPRRRSHSRVLVPRDSWPYFTVSDSKIPQPGGLGTRIYIPPDQGGPLYPQAQGSLFVVSYNSQCYGGGIRNRSHTGELTIQSQSYVTTDDQSPSLSWNKVPFWSLRPNLYYCLAVAGLLMWGALSDERTGLSFSRVTVSSSKSVVSMFNLHFTCY
jgi:hypothetical protein